MTAEQTAVALTMAIVCGVTARVAAVRILQDPPKRLMRTNVNGREVPAALGLPVVIVATGGVTVLAMLRAGSGSNATASPRMLLATGAIVVVMGAAGLLDDLQGDERPRGFSGHLAALRKGRVTGGIVKLVAGGVVGLVAGALIAGEGTFGLFGSRLIDFRAADWGDAWRVMEVGLFVALTANLINLLDRAPGRSSKAAFILAAACVLASRPTWVVAAAPLLGALAGVVRLDLRERGMAGDSGVNAVGGVLGLGLATLPVPGRWWALAAVLALNLASERWSFSRLIRSNAVLARIDQWGRIISDEDPPR